MEKKRAAMASIAAQVIYLKNRTNRKSDLSIL